MTKAEQGVRVEVAAGFCRGRFAVMASDCEVLFETGDPDAALALTRRAAAEAWRIERKFSRYRPDNIVDRINRAAGAPVEVDAETAQLIDFAQQLYEISGGKSDITSGVLRRAWVFDGSGRVPSADAIDAILPSVGWHRVRWSAYRLTLADGMEIDLGGIGKEYAVDRVAALLREATGVSCLVNLGGDLVVTRAPSRFDTWRVGIESIRPGTGIPARLLRLRVGALATSGDANRYLEKDGRRYPHILDPRTGWPMADAPRAVTVAADTCVQSGMLATLAMLEGEGAEAFLSAQGVAHWVSRQR